MSQNDVEMKDPEKLPNDSGNVLQESKSIIFDSKVDSEVEKSPSAAPVSGDVNERENSGEDLDKCITEVKDKIEVKSEVKDQDNPESEANKPIEGSVTGKTNKKSEKEVLINTQSQAEEQTVPISAVERQIGAEVEVEEDKSAENVVEIHQNVDEIPDKDVAEKKPEENSEEGMDYAEHVEGGDRTMGNAEAEDNPRENRQVPTESSANKDLQIQIAQSDKVPQSEDDVMDEAVNFHEDKTKDKEKGVGTVASRGTDENDKTDEFDVKRDGEESALANEHANTEFLSRCSSAKAADHSEEIANAISTHATLHLTGEGDDGTPEDQTAFMKELESFYRERAMDFKPPKFYGQPLNCLKLWRAVIKLGGYDKVTGSKLWRQVGESFHPPKTCTTVSWTFRIFYEKSLLEFERHKTQSGELQLPMAMLPEVSGVDGEGHGHQGSGPGRARRDAAARAMQGWHAQRLSDSGEDKNLNITAKHEKNLKSIGSLKQKRPNEVEHSSKAARTELSKQLVTSVVDIGSPADWVKINVRQTKDCFEVYALVPGLLREEVRVQSDPAGRVVITGQPEQVDNPWGVTAFKKVISLPARIDPLQTSAVVSLHGRLLVRVPFEQSNI